MSGLVRRLRDLATRVQALDDDEIERFYPAPAPRGKREAEAEFVAKIEARVAEAVDFGQNTEPASVVPWVAENFPADVFAPGTEPRVASIAFQLTGQDFRPLEPVPGASASAGVSGDLIGGASVVPCDMYVELTGLNKPARLVARIGQAEEGPGVMARFSDGQRLPECSRPLVASFGERVDQYLTTRAGPLVAETHEVAEIAPDAADHWHRSLHALLALIVGAHTLPAPLRWFVYTGIVDHCGSHYPIAKDVSARLRTWADRRFAPIDPSRDVRLWSPDSDVRAVGTLSIIYFAPSHQQPIDEAQQAGDTVKVDLDV